MESAHVAIAPENEEARYDHLATATIDYVDLLFT
jgi:hypothetical protein